MQWQWRSQLAWGGVAVASMSLIAHGLRTDDRSAAQPQAAVSTQATAAVVDSWNESTGKFPQAIKVLVAPDGQSEQGTRRELQLCQFYGSPTRSLYGVDASSAAGPCQEPTWNDARMLPFETHGHGEYVGPSRSPHVSTYTVRVNDELDFVYRFTHEEIPEAYRLMVGDEIMIETFPPDEGAVRRGDLTLGRGLTIQPDGTIVVPYAGRVPAAGRTIDEVRDDLHNRLMEAPNAMFVVGAMQVVVTPIKTNSTLESLRAAVDARFGSGGQTRTATVTPEGTVQLVGIGSVPAQGLTIPELEAEINARYVQVFGAGVQVSTILRQFAPRFIWVAGEVVQPGQYQVNQPLTVVQAIALARGFNNGGNVREIVVFRRDDNWQLMATRIDVRGVFLGKTPVPSDDIWLRDNDVVVVPKGPILRADDFIQLVFSRGIYSVLPLQSTLGVTF